jgi:hypothetical protein
VQALSLRHWSAPPKPLQQTSGAVQLPALPHAIEPTLGPPLLPLLPLRVPLLLPLRVPLLLPPLLAFPVGSGQFGLANE